MTTSFLSRAPLTARNIMTHNPVSINERATLQEAAAFLSDRGISAAPVINDAGRPVGVLSRTDIIRFDSEAPRLLGDFINEAHRQSGATRRCSITVGQVMTPDVLSVDVDASLPELCEKMTAGNVHRLFVTAGDATLVGVISALDVLRCLTKGADTSKDQT